METTYKQGIEFCATPLEMDWHAQSVAMKSQQVFPNAQITSTA